MKSLIRRALHAVGYDLRRYRPADAMETLVPHLLKQRGLDVVLDIGANTGQFAKQLRAVGYKGHILSVEPLAESHAILAQAAKGDPNWMVPDRMAIGAEDGEITLHRSANAVSSSVLDILPVHTAAAPESAYAGAETVAVRRLDTVIPEWWPNHQGPLFVKLDVQGYEDRVLDGAQSVLPRIMGIQAELSLVPLYEGQLLYDVMMQRFHDLGFELYAVMGGFADRKSGRMYQFDVLYLRP